MYTASSILVKARTYFPRPKRKKRIEGKLTKEQREVLLLRKEQKKKRKRTRYCTDNRRYYREEYLKSDHWKQLRIEKLKQQNYQCEKCGEQRYLDVHHEAYHSLYNVRLDDLQVLCRKCHKEVHDKMRV
jgi:5-methylcytosine-specific restriction endonuclease McrA